MATETEYDRIADLSLSIDAVETERLEGETTSDFTRVTTLLSLSGPDGEGGSITGRGEDVIYDAEEHDALASHGLPDLTGEYTIDSFSSRLADLDLFPEGAPDRDVFRNYRRWGVESAALDLALRQAGETLAGVLDRDSEPVSFVASTRLGEPPTTDRLERIREREPEAAFKLDPTPSWDADVIESVAATAPVRILDLKGQYEGTEVDVPADPDLYRRLIDAFPEAILEDPALTSETEPLFEEPAVRSRVAWDAPIHGLTDVEALPWEPSWLNIKPSRFGSIESLLETIDACLERGISLYGGGQFELDVGRYQIQELASLWYPDGPNDLAPRPYNVPELPSTVPSSPLPAPNDEPGFGCESPK
ncbi:hypothetical protein OB905_10385 [Halobacteria archaeon AArc-dxtr1]|nr:hypothetical protein [Halobacteria archaeon AArc-dxtr1]